MKWFGVTMTLLMCLSWNLRAQNSIHVTAGVQPTDSISRGIVCELPAVSNMEFLLDSLLLPYRGRAAVVDFWATWCGPCRRSMKAIAPLKDELHEKSVDFIYITNETSEENAWQEVVQHTNGYHYRLSNDQWTELINLFKIRGIPTYMLFNRQGTMYYRHEGFPGNDTLRDEINAILQEE